MLGDFRRGQVSLLDNIGKVKFSLRRHGWHKKAVLTKRRSEDPLGARAANELSYSAGEACLCGDSFLGSSHGHMTQAGRQAG